MIKKGTHLGKTTLVIAVAAAVLMTAVVCAATPSKQSNIEYIDSFYSVIQTAEWKSLPKSGRVEALEMPSEFVSGLSDDELAYAVFHYPFIVDLVVHEDLKAGYEYMLSYSGIMNEYDRRENKQILLNNYRKAYLETTEDGKNVFYQMVYDALMSLSELESGNQTNADELVMYGSYTVHTVITPNGSSVTVWRYTNEMPDNWIDYYNTETDAAYPNATRLRSATQYYNCHSYAWYSTSMLNRYWMNNPSAYMSDGSYTQITSNIAVYDKLFYSYDSHSGIVTYVGNSGFGNVRVTSKWGPAGLYNHWYNDCPYSTTGLSNWR